MTQTKNRRAEYTSARRRYYRVCKFKKVKGRGLFSPSSVLRDKQANRVAVLALALSATDGADAEEQVLTNGQPF